MTDEGKSANTGDQNDKNEPEDLVVLTTQEQDESLTEQDESPAEESAVVDGVLEGVAGDVEDSSTIDSRDTEVLMDLFVSQYGVLPDDHPLVERCRGFFDRLCDDDSIEFGIFEGDMGIQAVAAANRTVYLTKGAIDFCQTEEELLFLLMHEIKHIESGHFDEVPDGKSRTFISSLGMGRRKELVDADMRALRALDKKGVNIDGAFSFLSRLGESDIGDAYDTAHGSLKDRLLLLKSSLNFADFAHYKPEQQTPLSDEVKQAEHLTEMRGFPIVQREIPGMEERAVLRAETIESLTLRELVVNYFDLKREVNERQAKLRNRRKKKFVMKDQYKRYVEISRPLLSRMEELIYEKMEVDFGFSNEVVDLFLDLGKKILIDAVWKWSAEGDGKFNQSFYSRLGDSDFTDRLLTLKGRADLDKWALNFRSRLSESAIKQLTQKAGAVDRIADECSNDESDKKFVKNLLLVMIQGYSEDGSIEDASYLDVEEGESGADLVDGRGESWFGHTDKEYTMMADLELGLDKYDTSQVMNNLVDDWDFGFVSKSERLWEVQAAITFMFGAIRRHFRDNDVKLSDEGNGYLKKMHGLFSSVFNEGFESIEVVKLDVLLQEMTRSDIPEFEKKMFMLMLNKLINSSTRVVNYQGIEGSEVSGYFQRISKMCHGLFDRDPKFATSGVTEVWFSDYARFFRSRSTSFSINVLEEVQQSGDLDDKDMDALLERFIITVGDRKISMEDYKSLHEHFWDAKYQRFCSRYRNILVANVNRDKVQVEEGHFEFVLEVCVENNVLRPSNLDLAGYGEGDLFYKLIKAKEWDQSGIDENFMILRISNLSRDPVKKERIEIKAWGRILDIWESEGRSVGDLLDVVPKWVVIPVDVMEKISEDMAESAPDIVKCKDYLADRLRDDERIGKFVAGEWLFWIQILMLS